MVLAAAVAAQAPVRVDRARQRVYGFEFDDAGIGARVIFFAMHLVM